MGKDPEASPGSFIPPSLKSQYVDRARSLLIRCSKDSGEIHFQQLPIQLHILTVHPHCSQKDWMTDLLFQLVNLFIPLCLRFRVK